MTRSGLITVNSYELREAVARKALVEEISLHRIERKYSLYCVAYTFPENLELQ